MDPVKLYVGEHYREPTLYTYTELMFPFWGVTAKESMPYVREANIRYQYSKEDFILVDAIQDCDYVHIPYNYQRLQSANPERLASIVSEAQHANKPLLIDGSGDLELAITIPNSVILRVSQYRYSKRDNEITIPFPTEDLLDSYFDGKLKVQEKKEVPSVGFTGWADIPITRRIKIWLKELPLTLVTISNPKRGAEHKGIFFRERTLRTLSKTKGIMTNFTTRSTYSGHIKTITGSVEDNRKEFVETLRNSDYALCVKGDANSSVRFYEALSMGCIPLFLDTACVLPLEDRINYKEFCVFVDWKDVGRVGEKLREFHSSCTSEQFTQMRKLARETYRNHLRIDAFSKDLAQQLRARVTSKC